MDISLRYGKSTVPLPGAAFGRTKTLAPALPEICYDEKNAAADFLRALDEPVAGPPLTEVAERRKNACIVVSDKTRRYGADVWLAPLLDRLNAAGIADGDVTVLFATGMHAGHTPEERAELAGAAAARVRLVDHDCDAADSLVSLGRTTVGTPVAVNRLAAEADLLIVTGAVAPHYYAGFTGGRKGVVPGIAARETVLANHGLNLAPGGGTDPRARAAVLDGNPIHEDMLDALALVRVDFAVQVITDGDSRPLEFYAGEIRAAHEAACRAAERYYCVRIPAPAQWVLASCGGHPKDLNFYQSHKSLDNAYRAVAPGGAIILFTECAEGIGSDEFAKWFAEESEAAIEAKLREGYSVPGHTALRALEKARSVRVYVRSQLDEIAVMKMGMMPMRDTDKINDVISHLPGEGCLMPHAAVTVPILEK